MAKTNSIGVPVRVDHPVPMPGRLPVTFNGGFRYIPLSSVDSGRTVTTTGAIVAAQPLPGDRFALTMTDADRNTATVTMPSRVMLHACRINGAVLKPGDKIAVTGVVTRKHPKLPAAIQALTVRPVA